MNKLFEQYSSTAPLPMDSTSPVGGSGMVNNSGASTQQLTSQIQRHTSEIALLRTQLQRVTVHMKNLETQLAQTISSVRSR